MKKHITVLLSIVFITIFLLASCVEIETDSRLPGNMASETNITDIGIVGTGTVPQTDISDTGIISETAPDDFMETNNVSESETENVTEPRETNN
ncbi:MAG: hypothetical protein VB118_07370, partial [Oscillospiraceae bacterium]|nr:hypothetical protein [Oscillospiraceae bacterium]